MLPVIDDKEAWPDELRDHIDPFDEFKPRKGFAYQWIAVDAKGNPRDLGLKRWKPVSRRRHPNKAGTEIPGKICIGGMLLVEKPIKKAKSRPSQDLAAEWKEMMGVLPAAPTASGSFPLAPESFLVSKPYGGVLAGAGAVDIPVEILVRVLPRYQNAAASMHLSVAEYMRRRMVMFSQRNGIFGLLLPVTDAAPKDMTEMVPLEFIEDANLNVERKR